MIKKIKDSVAMQLVFIAGTNQAGETVYKKRTYAGIDSEATETNINTVAQTIVGLQTKTLQNVVLNEKYLVVEE